MSSRSSVPLVRSRSIATLVTRNIVTNGNTPRSIRPTRSNVCRLAVEDPVQQRHQHARDDHEQRDRAVVAPELLEHPAGRGQRHADAHAGTASTDPHERLLEVVRAGALAQLGGRAVGDDRALAHQQQPVAAVGLVHHVAGDQQRGAVGGEVVEESPEVAPQQRVEPDRRLVEHEQLRFAQQGTGERDAGALAAGEPADDVAARGRRAHRLEGRVAAALPGRRARTRSSAGWPATVRSAYTDGAWVT